MEDDSSSLFPTLSEEKRWVVIGGTGQGVEGYTMPMGYRAELCACCAATFPERYVLAASNRVWPLVGTFSLQILEVHGSEELSRLQYGRSRFEALDRAGPTFGSRSQWDCELFKTREVAALLLDQTRFNASAFLPPKSQIPTMAVARFISRSLYCQTRGEGGCASDEGLKMDEVVGSHVPGPWRKCFSVKPGMVSFSRGQVTFCQAVACSILLVMWRVERWPHIHSRQGQKNLVSGHVRLARWTVLESSPRGWLSCNARLTPVMNLQDELASEQENKNDFLPDLA